MQPPSQNPNNPTGQPFYSQPVQPFAPPPPMTSPQGSYPPGEENYYKRFSQTGGPVTQHRAGTQGKLDVPPVTQKKRNGWKVVSLVLFILVLILATATTTLVLTRPTSSTASGNELTPASQPPTSVPTLPVKPPATVAAGTITKNLTLTCSQCSSDPVHVTINSIQN